MSIDVILARVEGYGVNHVTLTGGEPLAQQGANRLLRELCDKGFSVSLETSGALDISNVDPRVIKVMDLKTPTSGEKERNLYTNIQALGPEDQIKFVIGDKVDYAWSVKQLGKYDLSTRCEVLFSPVEGTLSAALLAEWILRDRLPVRFQIQLHKYLWGNMRGK